MRTPLFAILLLGTSVLPCYPAAQILFDDGLAHIVDGGNSDPGDWVRVEDSDMGNPTTVTVNDGADLGSGTFPGLAAFEHSIVTISGGNFNFDNPVEFRGQSQGTVTGGTIGNLGSVLSLYATDDAEVDVFGGTFLGGSGIFLVVGSPMVNVYGGDFSQAGRAFWLDGDSVGIPVINVFGTGFNYPPGPIADESGTLTGFLSDGSPINNAFVRLEGEGVINVVVVPEPSATMLCLCSILLLRRR